MNARMTMTAAGRCGATLVTLAVCRLADRLAGRDVWSVEFCPRQLSSGRIRRVGSAGLFLIQGSITLLCSIFGTL